MVSFEGQSPIHNQQMPMGLEPAQVDKPVDKEVLRYWYQAALNGGYERTRSFFFSPKLLALSEEEREYVLSFVERLGIPHQAAEKGDEFFLHQLIDAGIDVNALDEHGRTMLTYAKDPKLVAFLLNKEATFIHPQMSFLDHIIRNMLNNHGKSEGELWREALLGMLRNSLHNDDFDDIFKIPVEIITEVIKRSLRDKELSSYLEKVIVQLWKKHPVEVKKMAIELVNQIPSKMYGNTDGILLMHIFFRLISEGKIIDVDFIESILCECKSEVIYGINNDVLLRGLEAVFCGDIAASKYLQDVALKDLFWSLVIARILKAKTVSRAVQDLQALSRLEFFAVDGKILNLRFRCLNHLKHLQIKENKSFWKELFKGCKDLNISQLLDGLYYMGITPKYKDPVENKTMMFSDVVRYPEFVSFVHQRRLSPNSELDQHSNNALEYVCKNVVLSEESLDSDESLHHRFIPLERLGLKLGDLMRNRECCERVFPNNHLYQALLWTILEKRSMVLAHMLLDKVLIPEVKAFFLRRMTYDVYTNKLLSNDEEAKRWDIHFNESSQEYLRALKARVSGQAIKVVNRLLMCHWKESKIPEAVFKLVPESPLVSLLIGTMMTPDFGMRGRFDVPKVLTDLKLTPGEIGVTVIPWERSRLEVKLNYDIVQYRRVFEPILHVSGLGSTIDFLQKLACNIDLNLRGEFRRPFNFYKAAISWHAPADWNYWTLGVYTSYTQGRNTLPNNAIVGLELSYVFGGNNSCNDGWSTCPWDLDWSCCDPCGVDPKLLSWVSAPAVMLPEVLSIADQLVVETQD